MCVVHAYVHMSECGGWVGGCVHAWCFLYNDIIVCICVCMCVCVCVCVSLCNNIYVCMLRRHFFCVSLYIQYASYIHMYVTCNSA